MPAYLQIILAIASVVVGISGVVVARAQSKLARQKLLFELFDRRMRAKEGVLALADSYFRHLSVTGEAYSIFRKDAFNSRLLFPKNAAEWIREIGDVAFKATYIEGNLNRELQSPAPAKDKIEKINAELQPLHDRIRKLYTEADEKLDEHIRLR
jgi:hypothetical protein